MTDRIRVSMVAEQLLQPVPGGIGVYVRAMLRALPRVAVEVEPVVAWHTTSTLSDGGVPQARRLPMPRQALYRRWTSGGAPGVGGTADLVHAASLAIPKRDTRPMVVTVHDLLFNEYPDAYPARGVAFHRAMLDRIGEADLVIVPSQAVRRTVEEITSVTGHVRVVPMGTELRAPSDADRDRILDALEVQRPYVLWVGTLEPRKNPEGVVRGFVKAVRSNVPDAADLNLYLVGPPGWWRKEVGEFIASEGVSDRVRRLDWQPRSVLAALYAGAAAFVYPSFAEGFGLPVLEAMACGAPVVTSNRSSLPEVSGAAAELCDPDDDDSIGEAIAKVLRDEDLAGDLRRLGRTRAADFTWRRTAADTRACYEEVLGAPAARAG